MSELLKKVEELGVVPVVVLNDAKDAAPLAKALCEGGLPCAEVTFRTDAAEESIRIMAQQFPEMLLGAGTVLTIDQVDRAVAAGAKFMLIKKYFSITWMYYTIRSSTGCKTQFRSYQILPGRTVWWYRNNQSIGSTLYKCKIYAYRRNQC